MPLMLKNKHINDWAIDLNISNDYTIDNHLQQYCIKHNKSLYISYIDYSNSDIASLALINIGFNFIKYNTPENPEHYGQIFYMKDVIVYLNFSSNWMSVYSIGRNNHDELCTKIKQEIKDIETMQKVLS